jgi:heparosan-N-sulfate-glucuronate 5-epimerase
VTLQLSNVATSVPGLAARGIRHVTYLKRALEVYTRPAVGPLSFWYEAPQKNAAAFAGSPQYFMNFQGKAAYAGPFDADGVPLLDYRGNIGRQYNPIAIAQYGLARFNCWCNSSLDDDRRAWLASAEWAASNLEPNAHGVPVWFHYFDWPYRELLKTPWYSGLAQGNGLSLLVRAADATEDPSLAAAAHAAFEPFERPVASGGVLVTDPRGHIWIEEYLVDPPSHILNGFIWAAWGVYDYANWSGRSDARRLWERCIETLAARLNEFDIGWWSLYESPCGNRRMLASPYYHQLHITQLDVLHELTGLEIFATVGARFASYERNPLYRARALAEKSWFKIRHY